MSFFNSGILLAILCGTVLNCTKVCAVFCLSSKVAMKGLCDPIKTYNDKTIYPTCMYYENILYDNKNNY